METWQDPRAFAIWLTVAILVVVLLATAFILFTRLHYKQMMEEQIKLTETKIAHQKSLLESNIMIQERERSRIAADLHDSLIPPLNSVLYLDEKTGQANRIREIISKSITIARNISHDLSPPLIEQMSIAELIEDFIEPLQSGFEVRFFRLHVKEQPISVDVKLHIFRIVQEVINNIIKHAAANQIDITLRETAHCLSLTIKDNGKGFDVSGQSRGLGQKNIESRVQFIHGKYRFRSAESKGTTFQLCLNHSGRQLPN
jgi:two-component system, NarL family, sensor kinase